MLDLSKPQKDKLNFLRREYPYFIYESYDFKKTKNAIEISFSFKIEPDIEFHPKVTIEPVDDRQYERLDKEVLSNLVFHLGLAEIASYWKLTCSPNIKINAGSLDAGQIVWWEKLLIKGLGEFFYQNKIDFTKDKFLTIKSAEGPKLSKDASVYDESYLILNGGGRDTVVAIETIKNLVEDIGTLTLNGTQASFAVLRESGVVKSINVLRELDPLMLEMNGKGYFNGHTPFSSYLAFLSILCAFVFKYESAVTSNERSSNEENIIYVGEKINHQYSKSFEFEQDFRRYLKDYLSEEISYFSMVRPLYEVQISKLFAQHKEYLSSFKSCNRGRKTNSWCGECAKCLSIYISLYPFVNHQDLNNIFGKNMYEDKTLSDLLLHLIGERKPKPFECVGTYEEVKLGLGLSLEQYKKNNLKVPYLLKMVENKLSIKQDLLYAWNKENFVPEKFSKELRVRIDK